MKHTQKIIWNLVTVQFIFKRSYTEMWPNPPKQLQWPQSCKFMNIEKVNIWLDTNEHINVHCLSSEFIAKRKQKFAPFAIEKTHMSDNLFMYDREDYFTQVSDNLCAIWRWLLWRNDEYSIKWSEGELH